MARWNHVIQRYPEGTAVLPSATGCPILRSRSLQEGKSFGKRSPCGDMRGESATAATAISQDCIKRVCRLTDLRHGVPHTSQKFGWPNARLIADLQRLHGGILFFKCGTKVVVLVVHRPLIVELGWSVVLSDRAPKHVLRGPMRSEIVTALGPTNHNRRMACELRAI